MCSVTDSTIAALFYAQKPGFNFARLIADLDAALSGCPHESRKLQWDHDDIAFLDVDGTRISLCWAEDLTGPRHGLMTVAVGPGPASPENDPLAPRREAICRLIADRIATRMPPLCTIWDHAEGVLNADRLDDLSEVLAVRAWRTASDLLREEEEDLAEPADVTPAPAPEMAHAGAAAAPDPVRAEPLRPDPVQPVRPKRAKARTARTAHPLRDRAAADSDTVSRLMARMDEELARASAPENLSDPCVIPEEVLASQRSAQRAARARARTALRMTPPKVETRVANDMPDLPRPKTAEAHRLREALYPEPEAAPQAEPPGLPARAAVGALSAALVVAAPPVGAALVVYNTLRGADLRLTARATALTGAFVGLAQVPVVQAALAAMI